MVLVTDGEEAGLMGAAALVTDREVTARLQAYINVEAIGSGGTGDAVRNRSGQRVADRALGATCAASARRVVRHRDLQAAAERHRFLDPEASRHSRPELRGGRRQLRVSHGARHSRSGCRTSGTSRDAARTSSRSSPRSTASTSRSARTSNADATSTSAAVAR